MVAITAPRIIDVILPLLFATDSNAVPTAVQHTTTSAIDPGNVLAKIFNMTIGSKVTGC
jgi:hypothetical protein